MVQAYKLNQCMQQVLTVTAEALAQQHGFRTANAKLGAGGFARTVVMGFLAHPDASLQDLAQVAATVAEPVTPQAIDQRFTRQSAEYLRSLLEATVQEVVRAQPATQEVLQRFTSVCVQDSTTIALPPELEELYRGCHGSTDGAGRAAVKFQVRIDLLRGGLEAFRIEQGRDCDYSTPLQTADIRAGSLHLRDLGYFDLDVFRQIAEHKAYFLGRLHDQTAVLDRHENRIELAQWLNSCRSRTQDLQILLGVNDRLPCRLVAVRLPKQLAERRRRELRRKAQKKGYTPSQEKLALCDWNVYVTNVPQHLLSVPEVVALIRSRWQIELLFKQWKSDGRLDESRSQQPWRVLGEVFAKMIALIIQHWILVTTCWQYTDRSLRRAAKTVRRMAGVLAWSLKEPTLLDQVLQWTAASVARAARVDRRRKHPSAYQVLENAAQYGYKL